MGKQKSEPTLSIRGNGIVRGPFVRAKFTKASKSLALACATHFRSDPTGRFEKPWRSGPRKIREARLDQMDDFRVARCPTGKRNERIRMPFPILLACCWSIAGGFEQRTRPHQGNIAFVAVSGCPGIGKEPAFREHLGRKSEFVMPHLAESE